MPAHENARKRLVSAGRKSRLLNKSSCETFCLNVMRAMSLDFRVSERQYMVNNRVTAPMGALM